MPALLALKIVLVPALIVAITLAGRRWGATVAGCLAGFPVVTGPILLFIALEQGPSFAAQAAIGATIAVLGNIGFGIVYSWVCRRHGWPLSLVAGLTAYACLVAIFNLLSLSALAAAGLTVAGLMLASRMFPNVVPELASGTTVRTALRGKTDLPYRMLAGLTLVLTVTLFSSQLGPKLSGLLAVFPVMGSVLAVFSHRNLGRGFAIMLLRGMVSGFYSFVAFCLILALTLDSQPLALAFLTALAAAIFLQAVQMRARP